MDVSAEDQLWALLHDGFHEIGTAEVSPLGCIPFERDINTLILMPWRCVSDKNIQILGYLVKHSLEIGLIVFPAPVTANPRHPRGPVYAKSLHCDFVVAEQMEIVRNEELLLARLVFPEVSPQEATQPEVVVPWNGDHLAVKFLH